MNLLDKIEYLKTLTTNWDSYGASEICPTSIDEVTETVRFLERVGVQLPEIHPNARGGIDLEWDFNDGEFSVTISPGRKFEYYLEQKDMGHENFDVSPAEAHWLILKYIGEID